VIGVLPEARRFGGPTNRFFDERRPTTARRTATDPARLLTTAFGAAKNRP